MCNYDGVDGGGNPRQADRSPVVLVESATPEYALDLLRPDGHGNGGRIEFLPWVDDASTSSLIERVGAMSPTR